MGPDDIVVNASLSNMASATSGDYFQIYKFGHHHIVHPGYQVPLKVNEDGVASATILAPSAAVADAIATAALVASGMDAAQSFLDPLFTAGIIAGYCLLSRRHHPHMRGPMLAQTDKGAALLQLNDQLVDSQPATIPGASQWDTLERARPDP